jgi:hypothetical protein
MAPWPMAASTTSSISVEWHAVSKGICCLCDGLSQICLAGSATPGWGKARAGEASAQDELHGAAHAREWANAHQHPHGDFDVGRGFDSGIRPLSAAADSLSQKKSRKQGQE